MTLENVSLERHNPVNVWLERKILETFSMRKCLSNDTVGPIKYVIRNSRESDVLMTHSLTSHFIGETSGLSKRNAAKFRELCSNFLKLAEWLWMGWPSCLAALGLAFSNRGTFPLRQYMQLTYTAILIISDIVPPVLSSMDFCSLTVLVKSYNPKTSVIKSSHFIAPTAGRRLRDCAAVSVREQHPPARVRPLQDARRDPRQRDAAPRHQTHEGRTI